MAEDLKGVNQMSKLRLLEALYHRGVAFRNTAIVDDWFPEVRDKFDLALDRISRHDYPVTPKIICLCGSTRFADKFMEIQFQESIQGNIVLSVGCFPRKPDGSWDTMKVTDKQKVELDKLHFRKIELADEIFVINVGGYVGPSTRREIVHAENLHKPIKWLETDGK